MTRKKFRKLSPANLEIMNIIWEMGEVTINDIVEAINAKRADNVRRTTIQVQMSRLEEYGWLKHKQKGRTFYYSAVREKHKTRSDILNDIKNRVFDGSRAELVKCLLEDSKMHPKKIEELHEVLKEQE